MYKLSLKKMGIIYLAGFLLTASQLLAIDDFEVETDQTNQTDQTTQKAPRKSEPELIDEICQKMLDGNDEKYPKRLTYDKGKKKWEPILGNPKKDPFEPMITKTVIQATPVPKVQAPKPIEKAKPQAPKINPIKLTVNGIVGNEGSRLAIIKFENEEMTISKDQIVEGKFKVVDIYADRVVVYSNKEQRRHTFKIGGDDSKN